MNIEYVWGPDGPSESWKIQNVQLTGVQNTLTALGFEAYSYVPGTGWSREYWRNIDNSQYVQVTYTAYNTDIEIKEIFP